MIKTVLIDIDGTLLDFNEAVRQSIKDCSRLHNLTMPDNILEIFHPINNELWHRIERGELTVEGLKKIRWNLIFNSAGIEYDGELFEKDFYIGLSQSAVLMPYANEAMEYLANKYTVFAATNAKTEQQKNRLKKCGLDKYLSGIYTSEMIGASKPSPVFFKYILCDLGSPCTDSIIMIGDSMKADIIGANAYGLKTCLVDPTNKHCSDEYCNLPDYIIHSLDQIKSIL